MRGAPARISTRRADAARPFEAAAIDGDVVVDAIFGIGITRPVADVYARAIEAANASGRPVLAIDLPSGLDADRGEPHGTAIRADATVSFIGRKLGCYLGAGPDLAGSRRFADLGVPPKAAEGVSAAARLIGPDSVRAALPPRARTAHKGRHGHVLVIGGAPGMGGAARLAGEAALRAGAGLVSIATHPASAALADTRPELMVSVLDDPRGLTPLLERASIIAVGPGLGRDDWGRAMLEAALRADRPAVVDADALNFLAVHPRRREDWVLTPHPGEAARMLGVDAARVQADRLGAARELQQRYGGTVVLKGAGSIVQTAASLPAICDRGNPGMAVAGMGDVLTGVVAGIAAQCRDLPLAAATAVYAHAQAGDRAARAGERGLLALDVIDELRACVNPATRRDMTRGIVRELATPRETQAAGAELGDALLTLSDGEPWLVGLEGELGAGKTTFVAGLLGALGHRDAVRSPTYTFIEPYRLAGRSVYHCDLYRIAHADEIEELGLRELAAGESVLLIEWPSRAEGRLGAFDVLVQLEYAPAVDARRLHIAAGTSRGARLASAHCSITHHIPPVSL